MKISSSIVEIPNVAPPEFVHRDLQLNFDVSDYNQDVVVWVGPWPYAHSGRFTIDQRHHIHLLSLLWDVLSIGRESVCPYK